MNNDSRHAKSEDEPHLHGDPFFRDGSVALLAQEETWARRLLQFRYVTRLVIFATCFGCLAITLFDASTGIYLLLLSLVVQTWIHSYFTQRVGGEDATGPGPVKVSKADKLSSRAAYDVLFLAMAAIPLVTAIAVLVKRVVIALQ
jgi:hypothetical protein